MHNVVYDDQPARSTSWKRWPWLIAGGLLLSGCLFWTGLFMYLPVLPQIWSNHLSRVQGKAELLAPAQWGYDRAELSPGGRWIVLFAAANPAKAELPLVWDLVSGKSYQLHSKLSDLRWLNDEYFVVSDGFHYYLFNVSGQYTIDPEYIPTDTYFRPGGFQVIEPLLRKADELYLTPQWGADYKAFALIEGQWYVMTLSRYEFGMTKPEIDGLVAAIPHVDVAPLGKNTVLLTKQRVSSPDGRFYVTREIARRSDRTERVAIYTQANELVAEAYKSGWDPYVLGWAQDGSGVYFRMYIDGLAASAQVPYRPLFKLSPFTPAEEIWALSKTIALWACGLALVVGAVRWRMQRRRLRVSSELPG